MTDATDLPPSPVTWAYVDSWTEEPPALAVARERAASLGIPTVTRATGAALRALAAAAGARSVIEVGTGSGIAGGWILDASPEVSLTTVDPDPAHQAIAREALAALGVPHTRVRVIAGEPREVLPRLADAAYDLVVVSPGADLDRSADAVHVLLADATRLLRHGGALVIAGPLGSAASGGRRDLAHHLRDDPDWTAAALTVGEGLIVAVHRPVEAPEGPATPAPVAEAAAG